MKKRLIIKAIVAITVIVLILISLVLCNYFYYQGFFKCYAKFAYLKERFDQYERQEGELPLVENWCDELFGKTGSAPKEDWQTYTTPYLMNSAAIGAEQPLPDNLVLVFNSDYSWNESGGKEDVSTTLLPKKNGILVLFAGGEIRFVEAKDIDSLKWNLDDQ